MCAAVGSQRRAGENDDDGDDGGGGDDDNDGEDEEGAVAVRVNRETSRAPPFGERTTATNE